MTKRRLPIDYLTRPIKTFINNESMIGFILFFSAVAAMVVANSSWGADWYHHFWEKEITFSYDNDSLTLNIHHFINDGLMSIFFFMVGLEIKREFIAGALSHWRKAVLPIGAAIGGMVFPAAIFLAFTYGRGGADGWGIPMATDIAFTLGLISLVKRRLSASVTVFVTSLAVVDDIGAVLVIAFFYTSQLHFDQLIIAGGAWILLMISNRLGVRNVFFYTFIGITVIWISFFYSGIHPTIAGILLAFTIPAKTRLSKKQFSERLKYLYNQYTNQESFDFEFNTYREEQLLHRMRQASDHARTPLQKIESGLHAPVYFVIMPLFAFANAGMPIDTGFFSLLLGPIGLGVLGGLILGKIIGVSLGSRLLVALGIGELPERTTWRQIYCASIFTAIGFTMSLFIAELAYQEDAKVAAAKSAILVASAFAAVLGLLATKFLIPKKVIV